MTTAWKRPGLALCTAMFSGLAYSAGNLPTLGNTPPLLPALLDLYQAPPLLNADAGFNERMEAHRQRLMQFYRASLHAYDGDRDAWSRDILEVMRGDGGNPYFRWFTGN